MNKPTLLAAASLVALSASGCSLLFDPDELEGQIGSHLDSGISPADAAQSPDAGEDAGTPQTDAGEPEPDAGEPDAGADDGGEPEPDGGGLDAGEPGVLSLCFTDYSMVVGEQVKLVATLGGVPAEGLAWSVDDEQSSTPLELDDGVFVAQREGDFRVTASQGALGQRVTANLHVSPIPDGRQLLEATVAETGLDGRIYLVASLLSQPDRPLGGTSIRGQGVLAIPNLPSEAPLALKAWQDLVGHQIYSPYFGPNAEVRLLPGESFATIALVEPLVPSMPQSPEPYVATDRGLAVVFWQPLTDDQGWPLADFQIVSYSVGGSSSTAVPFSSLQGFKVIEGLNDGSTYSFTTGCSNSVANLSCVPSSARTATTERHFFGASSATLTVDAEAAPPEAVVMGVASSTDDRTKSRFARWNRDTGRLSFEELASGEHELIVVADWNGDGIVQGTDAVFTKRVVLSGSTDLGAIAFRPFEARAQVRANAAGAELGFIASAGNRAAVRVRTVTDGSLAYPFELGLDPRSTIDQLEAEAPSLAPRFWGLSGDLPSFDETAQIGVSYTFDDGVICNGPPTPPVARPSCIPTALSFDGTTAPATLSWELRCPPTAPVEYLVFRAWAGSTGAASGSLIVAERLPPGTLTHEAPAAPAYKWSVEAFFQDGSSAIAQGSVPTVD